MSFVVAAAWDIASRIVMAHPQLRIFHNHEHDQYHPSLTLTSTDARIDITHDGKIDVHYSVHGFAGDPPDFDWQIEAQAPRGSAQIAADVVRYCQFDREKHSMTPRSLTYRLIGRALSARMFDVDHWDVGAQWRDADALAPGLRWNAPYPEMRGLPANEVWVMTCNDNPVTWLWEGWAWTNRGDRIDLMSLYTMGARLDLISPHLTELLAPNAAVPLPAVDVHGTQPTGDRPR